MCLKAYLWKSGHPLTNYHTCQYELNNLSNEAKSARFPNLERVMSQISQRFAQ